MTLEQLRIFIAVAEKQHVTRPASELNLRNQQRAPRLLLETRYGIYVSLSAVCSPPAPE